MNSTLLIVVGYIVIVTAVGMAFGRRNRNSDDWATGGGGMGLWLIAAGVAGTRIGGVGTYGVASDVMKTGLWNLWYGINTFLAFALVGFFFIIPYRRLKLITTGEIFVRRFNSKRSRILSSLCVQSEYFIVSVIEPYIIGIMLSAITGIPLVYGIYIGAAIIISYTAMSGIQGAAFTNVIHCSVIILSLSAVAYLAMNNMGGWDALVAKTNTALDTAKIEKDQWWSMTGMGWLPIIAMFFSATIHTPGASVYVNFASSAKNEKILIPAFLLAGLIGAAMPILSGIIGIEAVAQYGADTQLKGYTSITRLATDTGPFLGGLAMAAIMAALISSAGPILLGGATMFVNDWMPNSHKLSPRSKLKTYRIVSILYGLAGAIIASLINFSSIMGVLLLAFAIVVPPAIAITFVIYWKRTTEQGVFWGMAGGYLAGLLSWVANTGFDLGPGPAYGTTLLPLVIVPLVSLVTERETELAKAFYLQLKPATPPENTVAAAAFD